MRLRAVLPAAVVLLVSCGDRTGFTEAGGTSGTRLVAAPNGDLDQSIYSIFELFPKGLETAGLNRWSTVKRAYEAGLADPSKMPAAREQLFRLAEWVRDMASKMTQPANGESKTAAAARLALYMSLYIYEGPSASPPPHVAGADNAVGFVTPEEGATIVTPSTNAGVSLQAGAVDVNTIVVITENATPYPANCSGPLSTKLCQYPRFYHFSQFPHERLNIPAKFAVCHVNDGVLRTPLRDHDEFRLAHDKPASPADYTPGSTIRDQNGESIEILPYTTQTFSICDHIHYALRAPTGLMGLFARAVNGIEKLVMPGTAFAIDQGGGGESIMFSDFNNVDPGGVSDDSVNAVSAAPDSVVAGQQVALTYTVKNVGTATAPSVLASIGLTPIATTTAPPTTTLTAAGVMPLVPGEQITLTTTAFIPTGTTPGNYKLSVTLGSDPTFPDAQLANNGGARSIVVISPPPVILRAVPGKGVGIRRR